jgi:hypothetical protein
LNRLHRTTQVFYGIDDAQLLPQTLAEPNDVSGGGQFHFGLLKKPVGGVGDITVNGFQPANIDEGLYYGGIFQEDSTDNCFSDSL